MSIITIMINTKHVPRFRETFFCKRGINLKQETKSFSGTSIECLFLS